MMKLKKPWALRDAKASPLGRGGIAQAMTERASPFPKSICTAISIGFCQSDAIAVLFVL